MDQNIWAVTGTVTACGTIEDYSDWSVLRFEMQILTGWGTHERLIDIDVEAWGRRFLQLADYLPIGARVFITAEIRGSRTLGHVAVKAHTIGLLDSQSSTPYVKPCGGSRFSD